jgi:hypothetical protein
LKQARGSAKYWIPQLCQALKEENSNLSNEDIRDRVVKDCISIWQKDTIRDALPDEYKDKQKQEAARISHKNRNKSGQSTAFDESGTGAGFNPAETFSSEPTEQEPQTFDRPEIEVINSLDRSLPIGLYIITSKRKLVHILTVDFDKRNIGLSLWEKNT